MPIALPRLDNRSYADLLEEARALIPSLHPGWTDHNESDPGITLVELFVWLSDMLLYRIDQTPDEHYWAFLRLLNDTRPGRQEWLRRRGLPLPEAIRATVLELRERYRAVTAEDYEHLALQQWPGIAGQPGIRQARCVPRRDLVSDATGASEVRGHVSLVVVPDQAGEPRPEPSPELLAALGEWLEPRRLLGTRLHVVGPTYVPVTIRARLDLQPDYAPDKLVATGAPTAERITKEARERAKAALTDYFHPVTGGPDRRGWPLGRAVYRSELYQVFGRLAGVDYVAEVTITASPTSRLRRVPVGEGDGSETDPVSAILLAPHELVHVSVPDKTVVVEIAGTPGGRV